MIRKVIGTSVQKLGTHRRGQFLRRHPPTAKDTHNGLLDLGFEAHIPEGSISAVRAE